MYTIQILWEIVRFGGGFMKKEHEEIFKRYIVPTKNVYPLVKTHEEYVFDSADEKYAVMGKRVVCVLINENNCMFAKNRRTHKGVVLTGDYMGEKIDCEVNYFPADERAHAQGRSYDYAKLGVSFGILQHYFQESRKFRGFWVTFDSLADQEEFKRIPVVSVGEVMDWVDRQNATYKAEAEAKFKEKLAQDNMRELFSGAWCKEK